jgi:hypothetical protein
MTFLANSKLVIMVYSLSYDFLDVNGIEICLFVGLFLREFLTTKNTSFFV